MTKRVVITGLGAVAHVGNTVTETWHALKNATPNTAGFGGHNASLVFGRY